MTLKLPVLHSNAIYLWVVVLCAIFDVRNEDDLGLKQYIFTFAFVKGRHEKAASKGGFFCLVLCRGTDNDTTAPALPERSFSVLALIIQIKLYWMRVHGDAVHFFHF